MTQRSRDDAAGEARRKERHFQERQLRSNLLSKAMGDFELRHSKMFPYHEQEAARKAYCLGVVDGYVERGEELFNMGELYNQLRSAGPEPKEITDKTKMIDV